MVPIIRLLITLALLLWATTAQAQIAVVQTYGPDTAVYTASVKTMATGWPTLANGTTVDCGVANQLTRNFNSVTFGGQAMTVVSGTLLTSGGARIARYQRVIDGTESSQTVVVTLSGSDSNNTGMYCLAFTGGAASATTTADSDTASGITTLTTGPVTAGTSHNITIGYTVRGNRSWTLNGGWTEVGAASNLWAYAYRVDTSAGAVSFTSTTGDSATEVVANIVAYDGASGGGGGCTSGLTLLGAGKCD